MQFSAWHPLDVAARVAPAFSGVLEARAPSVLAYPRGRSAMVFYDAAADHSLAEHVAGAGLAGLRRAEALGAAFVRFAVTPPARAAAELGRLLEDFRARFGQFPFANQTA